MPGPRARPEDIADLIAAVVRRFNVMDGLRALFLNAASATYPPEPGGALRPLNREELIVLLDEALARRDATLALRRVRSGAGN